VVVKFKEIADKAPRVGIDQQRTRLGQALQPSGEVGALADDSLLLGGARPDQITHDDDPGGQPNADLQSVERLQLADALDQGEPSENRTLGVVLVRLRVAEIDQHPVAHILGDKSGKAADRLRYAAMVYADHLTQVFGIKTCGKLRRADKIAEHDRQLSPLGLCDGCSIRGVGGWFAALAQGDDRREQPAAVTDRGNAEILQVLGRQGRQHGAVDVVVAEHRLVLLQPETVEPCRNVHALLPRRGHCRAGLSYPELSVRANTQRRLSQPKVTRHIMQS
jgi:hypothetical protein